MKSGTGIACIARTAALVAAVAFAPRAALAGELINGVAAKVNEKAVFLSDVNRMVAPAYKKLSGTYGGDELADRLAKASEDALRQIMEQQLIVSCYPNPNPSFLKRRIDDYQEKIVRKEFDGDRQTFLSELAGEHVTADEWRTEVGEQIYVSALQDKEVLSKVIISPGRVHAHYEANLEEYTVPEKVKLSMIVIPRGAGDDSLEREKAVNVRKLVDEGKDFSSLAKEFSRDTNASRGGAWDWMERNTLKKELADAIAGLNPGDVSDVVGTDSAFYIVRLDDRVPASITPLADARDKIERELKEQEARKIYGEWVERLKKRSYVMICPDVANFKR